ncbi:hypothetical protein HK099_003363, partial [Clydaea vesicula]
NYWVSYFDHVEAIIFIAAVSSYDQKMEEDPDCNRLQDSLKLFEKTLQEELLNKVAIILFLNKSDLFEKKVLYSSIVDHFSDFVGDQKDVKHSKRFFRRKFENVKKDKK